MFLDEYNLLTYSKTCGRIQPNPNGSCCSFRAGGIGLGNLKSNGRSSRAADPQKAGRRGRIGRSEPHGSTSDRVRFIIA